MSDDELRAALAELQDGGLVVIPTDTVYGIAALPRAPGAVEAVFDAKGRPEDKPLPVLGASLQDLTSVARLSDRARRAARHWPGPLTLVLRRAPGFDVDLGGNRSEGVAVRIPASPVALALLRVAGPLAVTSANLSGRPPATTVDEARAALGDRVALFLDGGVCAGRPSTVVSLVDEPELLRAGALSFGALVQELG